MSLTVTICFISGIINFITSTLLAAFVLAKSSHIKANRYFSYFCFCGSAWSFFYFMWLSTPDRVLGDYYFRTCMVAVFFMPATLFDFVINFLKRPCSIWFKYFNYALALTAAFFVYTPLYAYDYSPFIGFLWPKPGPLCHIMTLDFLLVSSYSFWCLWSSYQTTTEKSMKEQIKLILIALTFGYAGGCSNIVMWYRIPIPPVANITVSGYFLTIAYAIYKYQILDINIAIKNSLIYSILISMITVVYFVMIYLSEHFLKTTIGYHSTAASLATAGIITIFFIPFKDFVQSFVERHLFKGTYIQIMEQNAQLEKLDKLKNDFINMVSHELRSPLTVVRESISQIVDGYLGEINELQGKFLNKSLTNIDYLIRLINDLLDVSKMEEGKFDVYKEKIDIIELLEEVVFNFTPLTQKKGLQIKFNVPNKKIYALADKQKIIQVMTNLMGNAYKFTDKGHIEVALIEEETVLKCSVKDTGIGIATKDLPRLYSKFDQIGREYGPGMKGTGLGLVITKKIIERHGGEIHVESAFGEGTKFTFTLAKYNIFEQDYLNLIISLNEEIKSYNYFSLLGFKIIGLGEESNESLTHLTHVIKDQLLGKSDKLILGKNGIYIILPNIEKENAEIVAKTLRRVIKENGQLEKLKNVKTLDLHIVNYPHDGRTGEELVVKFEIG